MKRYVCMVLGIVVVVVVVVVGLAFWLFSRTGSTGGRAPLFDDTEVLELKEEKQLWYQEERWKEEGFRLAWRPTPKQLEWAKTIESALLFVAPIVDKETGQGIIGRIYINGFFIEEAADVDVLIWAPPISVRVEKEGYHPWDVLLGFKHQGLKELQGRVELWPED